MPSNPTPSKVVRLAMALALIPLALIGQGIQIRFDPPDGAEQISEEVAQQVWVTASGERRTVEIVEKKSFLYERRPGGFRFATTVLESTLTADGQRRRDPMMEARRGIPLRFLANRLGCSTEIEDYEEGMERVFERIPPQMQQFYRTRNSKQKTLESAAAGWQMEMGMLLDRDLAPGVSWSGRVHVPEISSSDELFFLTRVIEQADCVPGVSCLRIRTDMSSSQDDLERLAESPVPRGNLGESGLLRNMPADRPVELLINEKLIDPATGLLYDVAAYRATTFDRQKLPPNQPVIATESLRVTTRRLVE